MAAPQQQPMPGPATLEEGGFSARHRGWLVVGAAFLSNVVAFGITYSFGVMFDGVSAEFGAGRGATAAVFSLAMALHFLLGFVAGPATDRQPASPGRGVSPALDSRRPTWSAPRRRSTSPAPPPARTRSASTTTGP